MSGPIVDAYLADKDARAAVIVRALDRTIVGTRPDFDVAIKYRILMYALREDWRTWVCAVDATSKRVSLRFLYGVLLDDPLHVLRAGSSVLKTWDFALDDVVDPNAVAGYVREAVARYPDYKANAEAVLAANRAAARSGRQSKAAR